MRPRRNEVRRHPEIIYAFQILAAVEGEPLPGAAPGLRPFVAAGDAGAVESLAIARRHLEALDALDGYPPNGAMLQRIAEAQRRNRPLTPAERNFLNHEVTEAKLMEAGLSYEEAHAAALKTHPLYANYAPAVIKAYPEYFNSNWRAYWGIK